MLSSQLFNRNVSGLCDVAQQIQRFDNLQRAELLTKLFAFIGVAGIEAEKVFVTADQEMSINSASEINVLLIIFIA